MFAIYFPSIIYDTRLRGLLLKTKGIFLIYFWNFLEKISLILSSKMVTLESKWTQYSNRFADMVFVSYYYLMNVFLLAQIKRSTVDILFKNLIPLVQLGSYAQGMVTVGKMYHRRLFYGHLFNGPILETDRQ